MNLKEMMREALDNIHESKMPEKIKCVEGLISKDKTPEPLEKGILRRKHEIYVNKDGTIRLDLTDVPLTHFRPREIGLSVEKAIQLGYERDIHDQPADLAGAGLRTARTGHRPLRLLRRFHGPGGQVHR